MSCSRGNPLWSPGELFSREISHKGEDLRNLSEWKIAELMHKLCVSAHFTVSRSPPRRIGISLSFAFLCKPQAAASQPHFPNSEWMEWQLFSRPLWGIYTIRYIAISWVVEVKKRERTPFHNQQHSSAVLWKINTGKNITFLYFLTSISVKEPTTSHYFTSFKN